jgi:hypothetical protein
MEQQEQTIQLPIFLSTLPKESLSFLAKTVGLQKFKENNNQEDQKEPSEEELLKYLVEDDVVDFQRRNFENNNKVFNQYGLTSLNYGDLVKSDQAENIMSDEEKNYYSNIFETNRNNNVYLPFLENLIDTHKKKNFNDLCNTVFSTEEHMKEMSERFEQLMKQYQQQMEKNKKTEYKGKHEALHKNIVKLNDDRESRIARMREKLRLKNEKK